MKHLRQYIRQILIESIPVDVEVGDIILTGKFKNKRTIVKSIGTDEYGHPTINGKTILKFKIEKQLPKKKWSAKSREELNETIITEAAKTPADLGDMTVGIEFKPGDWISVSLWKIDEAGFKARAGEVQAAPGDGSGPCSGAYEVLWANAEGAWGFGPMLYDIAMELAGDEGLICDRSSVSEDAASVWEFYLNNRPDVIAKQLDDERVPFLQDPGENDPSDDCDQRIFRRKERYKNHHNASDPGFKDAFLDHWSTKAYVKTSGTPILDELKAAGKVTRK